MQNNTSIYLAPLQEFTACAYRNAYNKYFSGVDKFFTPYIVVNNDFSVKKSYIHDVNPDNNSVPSLVPQVLAGTPDEFMQVANLLCDFGYKEINWNLGCPYPMVTKRGRGAGILPYTEKIEEILSAAFSKLKCNISVKTRIGLEAGDDIFNVIETLNKFPLEEIIIHPRTGNQLYKGVPDYTAFEQTVALTKHKLVYNGDIINSSGFTSLNKQFTETDTWMIGRGVLQKPWLPSIIKGGELPGKEEQVEVLQMFHDEIFHYYSVSLSGKSHFLAKMQKFWTYLCYTFPEPRKAFKRIKKSGNIKKYELAVAENFIRLKE
jgi:tRNA-dihydrouridine synthase